MNPTITHAEIGIWMGSETPDYITIKAEDFGSNTTKFIAVVDSIMKGLRENGGFQVSCKLHGVISENYSGPLINPANVGREIVKHLRAYEQQTGRRVM